MDRRFKLLLSCLLLSAVVVGGASAQAPPAAAPDPATTDPATPAAEAPWAPATGDPVVDQRLADINLYAARYPDAFVDELVRYFDAPRALIEELLGDGRHQAGDLYYACALARVSGRPCRGVLEARGAAPSDSWEDIARGLGVAPGDARARRLREGMADSYARWARPLPKGA